jgi:hypothetical protein
LTFAQVHEKNFKVLHLCLTKAGHYLASVSTTDNEFDLAERDRIRWALLAYMREHKIGTPELAKRIKKSHPREMEIPLKTLQRTLGPLRPPKDPTKEPKGPTRTHDMALIICKAFVEKLPNKPMPFQALGQALYAIYKQPLSPDIAGTYDLVLPEASSTTTLSISAPSDGCAFVNERSINGQIHDGIIVATAHNAHLAVLRDRLMLTPRYVMFTSDQGYVCEYYPLKNPDFPHFTHRARLSRHGETNPASAHGSSNIYYSSQH